MHMLTYRKFVNAQNAPRKPLSKVKDMVGKLYTVEASLPENQVPSQLVAQSKENNARCARQLLQFSSIRVEGLFWTILKRPLKKVIFQRFCFALSSSGNSYSRLTCSRTSSSTQTPTSLSTSSSNCN